jgi:DNA-binding NtrC family response regulator
MRECIKEGNILICEYYEALRESFKLILEDKFNLYFAEDKARLFDSLNIYDTDLLILDVDRQDFNILNLLKDIKLKYPELKIMLVSSNFTLEFQENVIKIGTGFSFLTKVFDSRNVLEKVKTIIRGYSESGPHTYIVRISNTKKTDEI